jgi:ABC-type multidrug transport system permease subunit
LLAGIGIMGIAILGGLVLGVSLFHVPLSRAPLALVWTAFSGGAILCYFLMLQMLASTARGAQFLSSMVVFPLMMIGGSFFPLEVMPAWMANIGRWTPNGMAVAHLKQILFGRIDPSSLALAALAIGLPAVVAFAVSVRRMRGGFALN